MQCGQAHCGCEYFEILEARALGENLCNQTTLVTLKGAISAKARPPQHGSDVLRQDMLSMFCNTILLRAHSNSVLALDTTLFGECEHGIVHILPSLVISQCFDLPFGLVLCKRFELLEGIANKQYLE